MKKIIFLTTLFIISFFIFNNIVFAEEPKARVPENFQEVREVSGKGFDAAKNDLPGIIKNIWQNEARPVYKSMGDYLIGRFRDIWQKLENIFQSEFKKREPIIREEFKKEKSELKDDLKTEVPQTGRSLWDKIKEIIK